MLYYRLWPPLFLIKNSLSLELLSSIDKVLFLSDFKIFSFVFGFQKFDYDVSWCGFLWAYSVWSSLSFLNLQMYVFYQIWDIFNHYLFQYLFNLTLLFSCPSGIPGAQLFNLLLKSHRHLRLWSLISSLIFSIVQIRELTVLSSNLMILPSVPFILLLSLFIEFLKLLYFSVMKLPFGFSLYLLWFCCDSVFFNLFQVHNC